MSTRTAKRRKPEVTVSVNGYDCTGHPSEAFSAYDLEIIGNAFIHAAGCLRKGIHGAVECTPLVSIGLDFGGQFDDKDGLPLIKKYRRPKRGSGE